ncbi:F0F1 ATP synthase subunit A [Phenylobacterium montanum]|uniref:ATP synthase subunit a n=1 Tax=Phenylobacterium montanum TaxID=2823693 RepID=A0A975G0J5_9CAUL|nr:F0F1 ATP synthase subunit A [Caulobacter sp. S6]QUD87731.1 F0F1 ATP synthase subunit A [Caulobacter sp. S6]
MAAIEPMNQFMIHKIVEIPPVQIGGISLDMSITNSVALMMVSAALITIFFLTSARGAVVPGRMQALAETLYDLVDKGLTGPMIGDRGRPFLPFVFTLFSLIAVMNIIGLTPGIFTVTSQLAVTVILAVMTFLIVVIVGFMRNGLGFFKLFVPSGVGLVMAVPLALIEFISFMVRPVTLSMRLFGNMIGGHVVMYMFASFVIGLGLFALHTGGFAYAGLLGSALSLAMVIALMALEFIVAFLQAFVFAALTCTYLSDVVNLDHGH